MYQDASRPSLTEIIQSRNYAPDHEAVLLALAGKVERLEAQLEFQEMQARCEVPGPSRPQPRHKRERHLWLVTAAAVATSGALAALRAAAAWSAGRGARKAAAAAAGLAVAGGAVIAPQMAPGAPAGPDVVRVQPVPEVVRHHPRPGMLLPVGLVPVMAHRRRRAVRRDRAHAAVSPSPSPAAPSPSPSMLPTPSPAVTPTVGQVTVQAPRGLIHLS